MTAEVDNRTMADKSNVLRDKIAKIEAGIYPPN